jgi:hypothetical protein
MGGAGRRYWPMSGIGTNRTSRAGLTMSVLEGKADLPVARPDFSSKADIHQFDGPTSVKD